MNNLLVSAIIAVKNGERFLARAIQSILQQTYSVYEIIVVDGKSTDNTGKIAQSYPQVRYILKENNAPADAWNLAIDAAKGDLLAFLDHDDRWTPNKLSLQVNYLVNHPQIQYVIAKFKYCLEPGYSIPSGFKKELLEQDITGLIPGTLVARKSLFDSIGKFDTNLAIASDVDWFIRVKDQNILQAVVPEVLLYKSIHEQNLSANAKVNNQELLKVLRQSINRQRNQNLLTE